MLTCSLGQDRTDIAAGPLARIAPGDFFRPGEPGGNLVATSAR
jgi:hypothetical protein